MKMSFQKQLEKAMKWDQNLISPFSKKQTGWFKRSKAEAFKLITTKMNGKKRSHLAKRYGIKEEDI